MFRGDGQVMHVMEEWEKHVSPDYRCEEVENWNNLWESRGGSMMNGAPREFPESTQCTP